MPIPKIVTQYEYEKVERPKKVFNPNDKNSKSKAVQSDMDAADINKIMARFEKNGVLIDSLGIERQPTYGDFSELTDYHTMLSGVKNAERVFGTLPAKVRNRFNNDPQELIDFLQDSKNDKEAVEIGLKDPSVLPLPPYWDDKTSKWLNPKDGKPLAHQDPAPLKTGSTPPQGA